ncbi:MAG: hypothetical protein J2P57_19465, partial [Acidimicrobiaceae bacterium]|nr:hypothetical protein [Acidimicrobiaceae bacterium]
MSDTSSASPQNLEEFVTVAGGKTASLEQAVARVAGTVNSFYEAPCDPQFRTPGDTAAFQQARQLVSDNKTDERWIAGIRQAFIDADSNTLPDASIAAALRRAGINPASPTAMTVDEPVYQGATMYSGWSDDPVSTGAGHFLEVEDDLAMPAALRVLRWTRTYSSRFVRDEGL